MRHRRRIADNLPGELMPVANDAPLDAAAGLGQLNALPSDLGTLMAGSGDDVVAGMGTGILPGAAGKSRGGRKGGSSGNGGLGTASFFGTEARGNRIVFLVDNSGSMKQGRMETTLLELLRSVDQLSEKQYFYVIFYSDQAYPMFYPHGVMQPVPATRENKQKLYEWLQTVELCIGGQLLKAMELAASLHPHVVYVLSDGDISSSRTMEGLTAPNDWDFTVHTLGMGVSKPEHAANLTAIAQAHHGTFQMVQPTPDAVQSSRRRPIHSNSFGVTWGTGFQQRLP